MAFSNAYTFGFAAAICIVCSTALAGVSLALKPMQEANARRDLQKNILQALDLPGEGQEVSGEAIDRLWNDKVEVKAVSSTTGQPLSLAEADLSKNGTIDSADFALARLAVKDKKDAKGQPMKPEVLGLFVRKDNGTVAVPMFGKGLWGDISAYIAFDPQMTTVKGATFFAPKETPGLGAEITATPFKKAWVGKTIVEGSKTTPIRVLKGAECQEATDPHCVDGISGATLTSVGVDKMVDVTVAMYEPYFKTVR
ncbi:MAG: NADH:ubiquinone reductase (Na(+)-transporting) subunit C [Alphaproteobacteria bacterium]|nr:NADH:ubiquinone reductase (Na(+)-transporting) subunit C [Alphaproteobacteria bacterium]MCB9694855.1 NADH:ubiquinone reductase (Na(+)-transporting) subunit C [Alphaproteobacteria bacterium]